MYMPLSETEPMLMSPSADKTHRLSPSSAITPRRLEASSAKCNDAFFAVVFVANVVILSLVAIWKGVPAIQKEFSHDENDDQFQGNSATLTMIGLLCAVGTVLSLAWIKLLMTYAASMIRVALWLNVGMVVSFAVSTFAVNIWAALFLLFLAALNVCYIVAVENRIAFASANIQAACAGLKEHSSIFAVAFLLVLQQLVWMFLWGVACVGLHQLFLETDPNCDRELDLASRGRNHGGLCVGFPAYVTLFYMLVSLYWGQQVLQNILTCTTAGVIATWWYHPNGTKATTGALYRSITTSFGSICFGSLLVAVLQALRTMAEMAKRRARGNNESGLACFACIAECILSCLAGVMEYINHWAYVYVGVYGHTFRTSGKAVMDLFRTRGWTAVINDDLTSSALSFGAMGVGIVTCCVGLLMVHFLPVDYFTALGSQMAVYSTMALIGFIVGLSMAMILAHVIIAALHTIFVCFAEDPVAFNRNHPKEYEDLVAGWRQFHGDVLLTAYRDSI
ncbi:hypothetical protein CCR75_005874 [Bremia lactucae]|uniref:Choline transporter-like protein n=1 Tax=Bremia lactucae TaxID=4779 RepID=A0A976FLT6_BRELC|nr:hypothetical protein CCR75_005874 [Bremia lactucae]